MPYGIVLEFEGIGKAEYDAVNDQLGIDMSVASNWPDGLRTHAGGTTAAGLCVFEVWESKAHQEAFMSSRLGPAIGAAGVPAPARVTELDIVGYNTP